MNDERTAESNDRPARHGVLGTIGLAGLVGAFLFLSLGNTRPQTLESSPVEDQAAASLRNGGEPLRPSRYIEGHRDIRDTVYTTDSIYLLVDLQKQNVTVVNRNGSSRSFLISSGTPYVSEGMSTPTGIFTVQYMTPMAISRQFNDARLHNWIGVYGGVGFHGLDGSGYYGHLGKRPSSHGCIRMAREAIKEMYDIVHVGAIIHVRDQEPARVVAFCDPVNPPDGELIDSVRARTRGLGDARLKALYAGRLYVEPHRPLVHSARTRIDWRIDPGLKTKVVRQEIPRTMTLPSIRDEVAGL